MRWPGGLWPGQYPPEPDPDSIEPRPPIPEIDTTIGICHMCRESTGITYCDMCEHWFCRECRDEWWRRPWEVIKQAIENVRVALGKEKGKCCGPDERSPGASGQRESGNDRPGVHGKTGKTGG